jgi:penicillin-binding protein 1A
MPGHRALSEERRRQARRARAWRLIGFASMAFLVCVVGGIGVAAGVVVSLRGVLPSADEISNIHATESTRILSSDNKVLARVAIEKREFVPITRIPRALQEAVVAIEDNQFYEHPGVNLRGLARATVWRAIVLRQPMQGGSSITQQLARNIYLTQRRTIARKLQEMILALEIERRYSKQEILELYLNQIYYGSGAYGVQVAAETFFGKDVDDLDLAECALLAGLPKSPLHYNPFDSPDLAVERRNLVLRRMRELHYVSPDEAQAARERPLRLAARRMTPQGEVYRAPYFTNYVLRQLVRKYGADVIYHGGLTIRTTLNLDMQEAAESALQSGVRGLRGRNVHQGALVAMDPRTGAIKAYVGGVDWGKSKFDRVSQSRRQPGSSFKIFVYTTAMDNGWTPTSVINDSPVSYPGGAPGKRWTPKNYGGGYSGPMSLRTAFAKSVNVVAVKLAEQVKVENIIRYAKAMGIDSPLAAYLPLALGASAVKPIEMATAVSVIANDGKRSDPYFVTKIEDPAGNVWEEHQSTSRQVLPVATAQTMKELMYGVVRGGTGRGAAGLPFRCGGKTGTTTLNRDAWFVGFSPDLAAAVWLGNDDNEKMRSGTDGGKVSTPIWANFMRRAQPLMAKQRPGGAPATANHRPPPAATPATDPSATDEPEVDQPPSQTFTRTICSESGLLATKSCPNPMQVTYVRGEAPYPPTASCSLHAPAGAAHPGGATRQMVTLSICPVSHKLATRYCPHPETKALEISQVPSDFCNVHGGGNAGRD